MCSDPPAVGLDDEGEGTTAADFYERMARIEIGREQEENEYKLKSTRQMDTHLSETRTQRAKNDSSRTA
jgi:hypothetical protein